LRQGRLYVAATALARFLPPHARFVQMVRQLGKNQSDQASLREAAKRVKLTGGCRRNFFVPPGFAGPRGFA
jgi:hypothetical protein